MPRTAGRPIMCGASSWPESGRFDLQSLSAIHQINLKRHIFGRIVRIDLGAHADNTVAQSALQGPERLPFEAIDRIGRRMALRDRGARELLAGIVVVAGGAGEVELAFAAAEQRP